jgi:hypothetical protein
MVYVYFRTDQIRNILAEISDSSEFSLAIEDIWNPQNYPDEKVIDELGRTENEAKKVGSIFWPDKNAMDRTRIPPRLMLAGDRGIYLTSNAVGRSVVVYAEGADPNKDEDCYNNKASWFGYDDGVIPLPMQWAQSATRRGSPYLVLGLRDDEVSLVQPNDSLN